MSEMSWVRDPNGDDECDGHWEVYDENGEFLESRTDAEYSSTI